MMATVKIILYRASTNKDGSHLIYLQVTENRRPIKISLGYRCQSNEWDDGKCRFKRNMEGYKQKNVVLAQTEKRAEIILDQIRAEESIFTPNLFKDLFKRKNKILTVDGFFKELMVELEQSGRIKTKQSYQDSLNAIQRYSGKTKQLHFRDIDYEFLKKMEAYLRNKGCNNGGLSHYMRTLRTVFNEAIRRGYVDEKLYPFQTSRSQKGYQISSLKSNNKTEHLSIKEMDKLKAFAIDEYPQYKLAYNVYMFSYYSRGMNFKDIASLKKSVNLKKDRIVYRRSKTKEPFSVKISDNLKTIIKQFPNDLSDYVFPILSEFHQTEQQQYDRRKKVIGQVNRALKEIAKLAEIETKMVMSNARHTFANALLKNDVSIDMIGQSMGHSDTRTTQIYLKGFVDEEIDKLDGLL